MQTVQLTVSRDIFALGKSKSEIDNYLRKSNSEWVS